MADITIKDLYDLNETIAKSLFDGITYPWEALPRIKEYIIELGKTLDPAEYEYDLNKVTDAGFYRLHMLGNWKNRPAGSSTGTHYMNVFRNSGNSKTLQQLFYHKGSRVWVRSFTSSETLPWYKFETSAVDTITTVSGGTSGDD